MVKVKAKVFRLILCRYVYEGIFYMLRRDLYKISIHFNVLGAAKFSEI